MPKAISTGANGACLCGAVTFAIEPPYHWFSHCHCSMCRKQSGTLFGMGLGVTRERFSFTGGTEAIVHYRATPAFERPFCGSCSSSLPAASQDERYWNVPAGLLTEDPGMRPRSHIFVASKSPLTELSDGLPQHATYPRDIGSPAVERRPHPPSSGIVGSCLCEAVAFEAAAMPRRTVNCYCSLCRRRTGSAFMSTLLAASGDFRWLRGEARVGRFVLPAPRSYSADFCTDCGSPVPSVLDGHPIAMLPAGSIDSDLPQLPSVHLYVGSKADWFTISGTGLQFEELPPQERFTELFQ